MLESIQTADKKFETQTNPILIGCSDYNDYVCKYGSGEGFQKRLLCEYIAATFLTVWNLPVPDYKVIKVLKEHIPNDFKIKNKCFNQFCFGSKYNREYIELTKLNELDVSRNFRSEENKSIFLKIALFDCWLSNDDRNHNNFNLLFDINNDYKIIPIDHEGIFNSRIFENEIFLINEDETILTTDFAKNIFNKKSLDPILITDLKSYFYDSAEKCNLVINDLLSKIPGNWEINHLLVDKKFEEIFSDEWLRVSFDCFQGFTQILLNKL